MPDYRCVRSFTSSHTGRAYYFGNKLSSVEYNSLPYSDQYNFTRITDEDAGYGSTGYIRFDERNIDDSKELKNGLQ